MMKYAINGNFPHPKQPSLWGVWIVTENRMCLVWHRGEKSYKGHEWLQYLVENILAPRGYYANGIINWYSEDKIFVKEWHTVVEGNSVRKFEGYSPQQKEPDIEAWHEERQKIYEERMRIAKRGTLN